MKNIKPFHFLLIWVFGFFALLSFDLFMEGLVFEWLEWNGTTKNDWFFALWWGFVVIWFIFEASKALPLYGPKVFNPQQQIPLGWSSGN